MTRRPKYLQNADDVQDVIDASSEPLSLKDIAKKTNLTYGAVQQAVFRLRSKQRITCEHYGRVLMLSRHP